jgi:hypothetical protein
MEKIIEEFLVNILWICFPMGYFNLFEQITSMKRSLRGHGSSPIESL